MANVVVWLFGATLRLGLGKENSMAINPGQMLNEGGLDAIISNTRVRASNAPVSFTDSSGAVTIAANPLGTNYIDGAGTPFNPSAQGSNFTLAASQMLTGICLIPTSASLTVTTDTAANILTAANAVSPGGVQVGDYISFLLMNDASGAFTMTIGAGSGVTLANANTASKQLAANTSKFCLLRFTNVTPGSAAVTMYF